MSHYLPGQTVKEAIQAYFKEHDLGEDGGLNKMWAKIKVGPIYLPLLNIPARRKALVFHDIHHIVTGYSGKWEGEVSISSWEISTGCGKYWVAWLLDLNGMAIGLFMYPKSVFTAFIRGRRTKNLYKNTISQQDALAMKIEDLQEKLLIKQEDFVSTTNEQVLFITYSLIALITFIAPFVTGFILVRILWCSS